jgi:hypothetical protein
MADKKPETHQGRNENKTGYTISVEEHSWNRYCHCTPEPRNWNWDCGFCFDATGRLALFRWNSKMPIALLASCTSAAVSIMKRAKITAQWTIETYRHLYYHRR